VPFFAPLNALALVMASDFEHSERMTRIIGKVDWIDTAGKWRKLIDNGYEPVLVREPRNYQ
jgi:hypothetical protein